MLGTYYMRLYDCLCLWVELPLYYTKWVFLASAGNIFYRNAHAISNRLQSESFIISKNFMKKLSNEAIHIEILNTTLIYLAVVCSIIYTSNVLHCCL